MQHALRQTATASRWVKDVRGRHVLTAARTGLKLHGLHGPHCKGLCWRTMETGLCVAIVLR